MLDAITSILGGGLTGFLGTAMTSVVGYLNTKAKNAHELAMIKAESDALVVEANANIKIAQAETEAEIEIAEVAAFETSQKLGNKDLFKGSYMTMLAEGGWFCKAVGAFIAVAMGLIDVLKASVRPGLTFYHVGVTTWITWLAYQALTATGQAMTVDFAQGIFSKVVMTVLYLTVTAVTWWFGDRRVAKHLMRMDGGV